MDYLYCTQKNKRIQYIYKKTQLNNSCNKYCVIPFVNEWSAPKKLLKCTYSISGCAHNVKMQTTSNGALISVTELVT